MKKKAILLMLALIFISTNALSQNTIYGTVSGDVMESVNIRISRNSCGVPNPIAEITTDSEGKYSYGNLDDGTYILAPIDESYVFTPMYYIIQIPQTESQSYDFVAVNSNKNKIAILVTDWGQPNGFDANYYSQIGYRGGRGPYADPNVDPSLQDCISTYVGIWPYLSAMGLMPWAVSYNSAINDQSGIYQVQVDGSYVNLLDPSIIISAEDGDVYEANEKVIPAIDYAAAIDRGRAFFGLDKRYGDTVETGAVDHLEGYYKILIPGGDGLNDLDESYNLYWVRLVAIMSIGFDVSINPSQIIMENEVHSGMNALFGDKVDVRFGMYEAVEGLTRREEDVAVDFADEGFKKMLLTRETTDNNEYANKFMTYGYVQRGLCSAGYEDEIEIKQVRQVGRTPEYNTMLVNTIKPAFERFQDGADVSVLYATYGLPYQKNKAAIDYQMAGQTISSFSSNMPWAQEVFAENAFNNYFSARSYIEKAYDLKYGGKYNLNFHKTAGSGECINPDCRMSTLYGYSLYPPYPFFGYPEDPDRFQSLRDNVESLKSQAVPPKHILIALSHWYYNSGDTAMALRDMNVFPLSSEEDIINGEFIMEWCEGSTTAGPDDTLENRQYTESYVFDQKTKLRGTFGLDENGECPEGYVHIVITEAFDDQMDDFSRGYFGRIRGGVERFGVFPSESLSLTIEAQGAISKLNGGNLTSTTGESKGARIDVPADPDPEKPDTLTYTDTYRPAGTADPNPDGIKVLNDPADRWDAAWFDFTAYIGIQGKALNPENSEAEKINLPAAPAGLTSVSNAVCFGPYRTLFNKPATITLPYDSTQVTNPDNIRPFIYNDITGDYDQVYPIIGGIDYSSDNNNIVLNVDGTASFSVQALGIFVLAECPDCNI